MLHLFLHDCQAPFKIPGSAHAVFPCQRAPLKQLYILVKGLAYAVISNHGADRGLCLQVHEIPPHLLCLARKGYDARWILDRVRSLIIHQELGWIHLDDACLCSHPRDLPGQVQHGSGHPLLHIVGKPHGLAFKVHHLKQHDAIPAVFGKVNCHKLHIHGVHAPKLHIRPYRLLVFKILPVHLIQQFLQGMLV